MKKPVFVFGIAVLVLALAFVLTDAIVSALTAGVTEGNIRRIRIGMLKPEIERILGEPGQYESFNWPDCDEPCQGEVGRWESFGLQVQVTFDRLGRVQSAHFIDQRANWL